METPEFYNLIQKVRLDIKLIEKFIEQDALGCKNLIYRGANKEHLYEYVSKIEPGKLSMVQTWLLEDLHNLRKAKNFKYENDDQISGIRLISQNQYETLLKKLENNEEFIEDERDKYIVENKLENKFLAIDNCKGKMWTEEFKEAKEAESCLRGEKNYMAYFYETEKDFMNGEGNNDDGYSYLEEAKEMVKKNN